ncbi:MAG: extracellular solute-binding protein [Acidimicrobiia bacterium]
MDQARDRRQFLRLAAGAVAAGALGACSSGSPTRTDAAKSNGAAGKTLRIAQWSHFVPGYDAWFDDEYTKRWGEEHDVEVVIDHIPYAQLLARADTEVASRRGHDLFAFIGTAPFRFEDSVIDHRDVMEETVRRFGPVAAHVEPWVRNAKTGKIVSVPQYWGPQPVLYRTDLWAAVGGAPTSWDELLHGARTLKAAGHPVGIGLAADIDCHLTVSGLLAAYGAAIQDEGGTLTIGRAATVEAVKVMVELFRQGMDPAVIDWDAVSDNRSLASGQASLVIDAISALRAVEKQDPGLARTIAVASPPAGPAGPFSPPILHSLAIWEFSEQRPLAEKFLVDLVAASRDSLLRSELYNLPAFTGAVDGSDGLLAADAAEPAGKYAVLGGASAWSPNLGHPGNDSPAVEEVVNQFIVTRMFAAAARGELSAEDAVKQAEAQAAPIFDKWRELGKI